MAKLRNKAGIAIFGIARSGRCQADSVAQSAIRSNIPSVKSLTFFIAATSFSHPEYVLSRISKTRVSTRNR